MPLTRLSILELVRGAYRELWRDWKSAVRIGLLVSCCAAASVYAFSAARWIYADSMPGIHWLIFIATRITVTAAATVQAVGWHRLVLLGQRPTSYLPTWNSNHTRFWGWSILLSLLVETPDVLLPVLIAGESALLLYTLPTIATLVVWYLEARFALILPASAVSDESSLRRAWLQSSGNGIRIALAGFMVFVPVIIPTVVLVWIVPAGAISTDFHLVRSAVLISGYWALAPFLTSLGVGVLSLAYRQAVRL